MLDELDQSISPHKITKAVIPELFEQQVLKVPEKVALFFQGKSITYSELNIRANKIAHWLIKKNIELRIS